jgi:polyphosphate kinase
MELFDFDSKDYYINRELSWLSFNERVLEEATNLRNPLLERLKFLAIASSNFDEFFMVRVAGLKDQIKYDMNKPEDKERMTPKEQVAAISVRVHKLVDNLYGILHGSILPELREKNIRFVQPDELDTGQQEFLEDYFHHRIFPVLTPMAVDASHPFPLLQNKSLNLAVLLDSDRGGEDLFAVVQVPSVLPRYLEVPTPDEETTFVLLEDVIRRYIGTLFEGNIIHEVSPFRITIDTDMELDEEGTEDLLEEIEKELKLLKMADAVRLEVTDSMSFVLLETLRDWLELRGEDLYTVRGPLDPTFFMKFSGLPGFDHLRFEELPPQPPRDLFGQQGIFEAIARKDILVSLPYEKFEPVVHFVSQAAEDPNVLAIKQTLYRVSGNSPIVAALVRAAENGKQVTVLLEIKARFDEENNIVWAKKLEKAGCHVIYGVTGLKTHSKITLVVRQEPKGIRRYVHLGTGNYNDITARIYTDFGLFTAREDFGHDASAFFNHITGYSVKPAWQQIATAPLGMKDRFIEQIENEAAKSTPERPGHIIAKMNALTDKEMIQALFRASCAGVKIDLIIRGICCLRPGIPGVSENIRVHSIVGRWLEHSRVYYFENGGDEEIYLSSADWMTRNLVGRVEILFPVLQDNLKERLKHVLDLQLHDTANRHVLQPDGRYLRVQPEPGESPLNSQLALYAEAERTATKKADEVQFAQLKPRTHIL